MRSRRRTPEAPQELGEHAGLAFARFSPAGRARGSVLVLHGASSSKETHFAFARAARAAGWEAVALDLPGHGESTAQLGGDLLERLAEAASLCSAAPLALRGSSLGGYLALVAAAPLGAAACIAICPAPAAAVRRGMAERRFEFRGDAAAAAAVLGAPDEAEAIADLEVPVLLMHADGDDVVDPAHSRELYALARHPRSRLVVVPGGHHSSVQHDAELQGESVRWLGRALG